MDEVVKFMTDFDLFGDQSKHMDKNQETGPKSPVLETVTQNAAETLIPPSHLFSKILMLFLLY